MRVPWNCIGSIVLTSLAMSRPARANAGDPLVAQVASCVPTAAGNYTTGFGLTQADRTLAITFVYSVRTAGDDVDAATLATATVRVCEYAVDETDPARQVTCPSGADHAVFGDGTRWRQAPR